MTEEQITFIQRTVKAWHDIKDVSSSVQYMPNSAQFRVVVLSHFQMPTGDGDTYWEEEVASIDFYSWETDVDVLDWVISQQ